VNSGRRRLGPSATLLLTTLAVLLILRDGPPTAWLRVSAPPVASTDRPFVAEVTLSAPEAGAYITLDLHGYDTSGNRLGTVAVGPPQATQPGTHAYVFSLNLRNDPPPARVFAVAYLSHDTTWASHFAVATSHPFTVAPPGAPLVPASDLPLFPSENDPARIVPHPLSARLALGTLWLVAAVLAMRLRTTAARWLAATLLALALLETIAASAQLAEHARETARTLGLYEQRRPWQQAASAAALVTLGALTAFVLHRLRSSPLRNAALWAAAGFVVLAATALSLHEIDRLLAPMIGHWPAAAWIRAAAAAATILALIPRRTPRTPSPIV